MSQIKTVPNQKVIQISKTISNKQNKYGIINLQAQQKAFKTLKQSGSLMWSILCMNKDNYEFALSPKNILDNYGIKKSVYDAGINDLISNNYLVKCNGGYNKYIFYEIPKVDNINAL